MKIIHLKDAYVYLKKPKKVKEQKCKKSVKYFKNSNIWSATCYYVTTDNIPENDLL